EEQFLRLVGGESRNALELALLMRGELLVLGRRCRGLLLAFGRAPVAGSQLFFKPLHRDLAFGERRVAPRERLLEGGGRLTLLPRLTLGVHQDLVRFFLRLEERFFLASLGVAFGVLRAAKRLLLGAADGFRGNAL